MGVKFYGKKWFRGVGGWGADFFRKNTKINKKTTTLGGAEKSCLLEHYKSLRKKMIIFDERHANKTIVQLHYTDWCPHCVEMKKIWKKLKKESYKNFIILEQNQDECNSPGIKYVPSIFKFDGVNIEKYEGGPDRKKIVKWMKKLIVPQDIS